MNVRYEITGLDAIFAWDGNYTDISDKVVERLEEVKKDMAAKKLNDLNLDDVIEDFRIYTEDDGVDYFDLIMENFYQWADDAEVWVRPHG